MKLTTNTFVSLDGVMQSPGGPEEDPGNGFAHGGWTVPLFDEHVGALVDEVFFTDADAILLGRKTYQLMAPYWSQVDDDEHVATALNTKPKYVVSTTLTPQQATWNPTTIISDNVIAAIQDLKSQPGSELQVHGSAGLIQTLIAERLVDEFRLLIFPVVLGSGKRLFENGCLPMGYEVITHRQTRSGVTALSLKPTELTTGSFLPGDE